jgi:signal transduction histidine kinase
MANGRNLSLGIQKHFLTRYAVALPVTAAALLLGRVLAPRLGDYVSYVAVFPALAFSASYCGLGPSALATVFAVVGLKYWFIPPLRTFGIVTASQALGVIVLLVASGAIGAMIEARRRENETLRRAQGELEDRVKKRTEDLDAANRGLRDLTARLMQMQDDERRRIARELHDSVGQTLAALSMNLATVGGDIERLSHTAKTVADSAALVQEMNKEVRTISYLLHPPLLDEVGLESALRWYVDGFSQRSKIGVDLQVAEDFGRLPRELETGIFRTVQGCLTNIHRHSGSPTARIRLARFDGEVRLQVKDQGPGIATEKLDESASGVTPGVGIRGMRERLRQLGGTLDIDCKGGGTVVEARLPVAVPSTT